MRILNRLMNKVPMVPYILLWTGAIPAALLSNFVKMGDNRIDKGHMSHMSWSLILGALIWASLLLWIITLIT
jgi:hypothetical protein